MSSYKKNDDIPILPISDSSRTCSRSFTIPSYSIGGFNNFQIASGCTSPLLTRRLHSSTQFTTPPMKPSRSPSGVSPQSQRSQCHSSRVFALFHDTFNGGLYNDFRSWGKKYASSVPTLFALSCLLAIFIDPFFFFLISIKEDHKCLAIDWSTTKLFVFVRTLTDVIFFFNILVQLWMGYKAHMSKVVGAGELGDEPKQVALRYIKGQFLLDLIIVLPLPQILILRVIPKNLPISGSNHGKNLRNLLGRAVLIQYIPKLYRIITMIVGQTRTDFIVESASANFVINLLTFMLAGHAIGSCWYFFGLRRVNQCLREACRRYDQCSFLIDCGDGSSNTSTSLLHHAWRNDPNAEACFKEDVYPYGIFLKTVKLTTNSTFFTRYTYSLFWGVQQISTLAGNLVPSYSIGEVFFTMGIIGLGLLLFALLIGNVQNFLQSLCKRRFEMTLRRRDVKQWMKHRQLPEDIRKRVIEVERFNWDVTRGVNEDLIFENMPEDLQRDIRRHLFKFLRKVKIFFSMEEPILDAIREPILDAIGERLKQRTYIKGSIVLHHKCIVEKMVFIVRGQMQSINEEDDSVLHLSEGDVCGEELLTWCFDRFNGKPEYGTKTKMSSPKGFLSNRIVKCVTNVEAFSLSVADLEDVRNMFSRFLRKPREGVVRYQTPYCKSRAATQIKMGWRYRKKLLQSLYSSPR